ncbi:MAG: DNA polymerase III subunit gamma/tau [Phycisphaerae bacterium]|jgi:DNA polymerase-3 subunit gamma/tau
MAYTVLARKYRSQTFDDVIGQDPIAQTLKNAIKTNRVAHAYLFTGTRGVGKTTMARILAKALNCLSAKEPTAKPCLECESCRAINTGEDIDVMEIDGASNNGVEEVRRLRENAVYRAARARYKIYIIDEVHMLSTNAFNALLKTLEEPPPHVKFIFATTEPNKVIATIQSRCQRFDFANINPAAIAKQLRMILDKEKINFEDDLVITVARMANGSMRDALSLLDRLISIGEQPLKLDLLEQFLGCPDSEKLGQLIEKIAAKDAAGTLTALDNLITGGLAEVQIVDAMTDYMRDMMVVKSAGADSELLLLTEGQRKKITALAEGFDIAGLIYSITALEKIRWQVKNTDNPRALLEALLLRFALAEHFLNVDQLLSQSPNKPQADVKKNASVKTRTESFRPQPQNNPPEISKPQTFKPAAGDAEFNWPDILEVINSTLGGGTAGLLNAAKPMSFENDVLTLAFDEKNKMSKNMCESNGRADQIRNCISNHLGRDISVKFIVEKPQGAAEIKEKSDKTPAQRRKELMDDPAVKELITGLGATITNIEEQ